MRKYLTKKTHKIFDINEKLVLIFQLLVLFKADPYKDEMWNTLDKLKKRKDFINSLHSKKMYKSVFQINKKLKLTDSEKTAL